MFGFLKKLKGTAKELGEKSIKAENKDLMEAMVGCACLIAYADGELEEAEITTINALLENSQALKLFGNEPSQEFDRLCNIMESGYRMGRLTVMKEIKDVAGNKEEAEMVLVMGIEVAFADGDYEPEEKKELEAIAKALNLKLDDYI